ncbi:Spermidine/putrescine import ABC transporter permease protein PotC (TC 3.A.1.11.1) [Olavius algarvensis associated proteobacterium Delta 3]|nr:Spermidine/putrescine import ABC transporter permease protein PotC (TC 3.A.1.11.1) [Olavius algarvensis associated proteobacterium Delta 3]CAB5168389.1 Spermidine/putrescine import ABC transporter permease protein PotC (TC 3.A.1.11.1) [Olavius algarvensis associated proteobacterium Delta 3]
MIRTLPQSRGYSFGFKLYMLVYFTFLFAPLVITCVLAFNDSQFPSLPWKGFTLEWFTADLPHRVGIFHDRINLDSIWVSLKVASFVTLLAVGVGTCGAFLFEQEEFRYKQLLYFLMISPLVIPGVILGISILMFSTTLGLYFEQSWNLDVALFRPGVWLVVLGQFSFIATLVTLVVSARLKKFDRTLEEAAMNLGANRFEVIWYITLRFLRPAIIGSGAVAFLMSFENFNTTLFLVGSEATLPINLYLQVRDGSTPVINAISFLLILGTSLLALVSSLVAKKSDQAT